VTDIFRAKFAVEMEAVGQRFEVAKFSSDWGLNDIPTAKCVLAIGRNAANGIVEAKIHQHLDELKEFVEVKVFFSADGEWSRKYDWPPGEFLIFEGKIQGIGFQKVSGKVELVAHLQHWLMDLNYGSSVNAGMHPILPAEYTFGAIYDHLWGPPGAATGAFATQPAGIAATALADVITVDTVRDDLWGQAIKPMLCSLARQEGVVLNDNIAGEDCFDMEAELSPSKTSIAALKRIEGISSDSGCSSELSCYTPKLSMNLPDGAEYIPHTVGDAIAEAISNTAISSLVRSTMWSKLVEYGEVFHFDVIPLVDSAIVVPKTFGLRNTWCKKIKATDYATVVLNSAIDKPIRGVAVIGLGLDAYYGAFSTNAALGIGGCYSPDPPPENGMIHIIRPPRWLAGLPGEGHSPSKTTGTKGSRPISTSTTPQNTLTNAAKGNKDGRDRDDIVRDITELYEAYARAMYIQNVLRTRAGTLSGKLRFDIAPGSVVEIEGTSDKFLSAGDNAAQTLIGTVVRVSVAINAEKAKAGTAFRIRDLRTISENEDDRTSSEDHPLYTTIFKGAPLVDDLLMPEDDDCCL